MANKKRCMFVDHTVDRIQGALLHNILVGLGVIADKRKGKSTHLCEVMDLRAAKTHRDLIFNHTMKAETTPALSVSSQQLLFCPKEEDDPENNPDWRLQTSLFANPISFMQDWNVGEVREVLVCSVVVGKCVAAHHTATRDFDEIDTTVDNVYFPNEYLVSCQEQVCPLFVLTVKMVHTTNDDAKNRGAILAPLPTRFSEEKKATFNNCLCHGTLQNEQTPTPSFVVCCLACQDWFHTACYSKTVEEARWCFAQNNFVCDMCTMLIYPFCVNYQNPFQDDAQQQIMDRLKVTHTHVFFLHSSFFRLATSLNPMIHESMCC